MKRTNYKRDITTKFKNSMIIGKEKKKRSTQNIELYRVYKTWEMKKKI